MIFMYIFRPSFHKSHLKSVNFNVQADLEDKHSSPNLYRSNNKIKIALNQIFNWKQTYATRRTPK